MMHAGSFASTGPEVSPIASVTNFRRADGVSAAESAFQGPERPTQYTSEGRRF
jgi:hypothetical protein